MLSLFSSIKTTVSKAIFGAPLTDEEYSEILGSLITLYVAAKNDANMSVINRLFEQGARASKGKLQTLHNYAKGMQEGLKTAEGFRDDFKKLYEQAKAAPKDTFESMLASLQKNDLAALTNITRNSNAPNLANRYIEQATWAQECHYRFEFAENIMDIVKEAAEMGKTPEATIAYFKDLHQLANNELNHLPADVVNLIHAYSTVNPVLTYTPTVSKPLTESSDNYTHKYGKKRRIA